MELAVVVFLDFVALTFDYINGFHDAANSIATVVSTRVLSPGKAVVWAAFFNFAAAFGFGTAVAETIGAGYPCLTTTPSSTLATSSQRSVASSRKSSTSFHLITEIGSVSSSNRRLSASS